MDCIEETKDQLEVLNPLHVQHLTEMMYQYHIDNKYCDTMIKTTSGCLFAHSVVLASASQKMKSLLHAKLQSDKNSQYLLDLQEMECDSISVSPILQFCYTGKFSLFNKKGIKRTIELATYLDIKLIVEVCTLWKEQIQNKDIMVQPHTCQDITEVHPFKLSEATSPTHSEVLPKPDIMICNNDSNQANVDKQKIAVTSVDNALNIPNEVRTMDISQLNYSESEINLKIMADVCSQKCLTDSEGSLISTDFGIGEKKVHPKVNDKERDSIISRHTEIQNPKDLKKSESHLLDTNNFNFKEIPVSSVTELHNMSTSKILLPSKPLVPRNPLVYVPNTRKQQSENLTQKTITDISSLCETSSSSLTCQPLETAVNVQRSTANIVANEAKYYNDTKHKIDTAMKDEFPSNFPHSDTINRVHTKSNPSTSIGHMIQNDNLSILPLHVVNQSLGSTAGLSMSLAANAGHCSIVNKPNYNTLNISSLSKYNRNIPSNPRIASGLFSDSAKATLFGNKGNTATSTVSEGSSSGNHSNPLLHRLLTIPTTNQNIVLTVAPLDTNVLNANAPSESSSMSPLSVSICETDLNSKTVLSEPSVVVDDNNKNSIVYANKIKAYSCTTESVDEKNMLFSQEQMSISSVQRKVEDFPAAITLSMSESVEPSQIQSFIEPLQVCSDNFRKSAVASDHKSISNVQAQQSQNELANNVKNNTTKVHVSLDRSCAISENSLNKLHKSDHSYVAVNSTFPVQSSLDHNYTLCGNITMKDSNLNHNALITNKVIENTLVNVAKDIIHDVKENFTRKNNRNLSSNNIVNQNNASLSKYTDEKKHDCRTAGKKMKEEMDAIEANNKIVSNSPTLNNKSKKFVSTNQSNSPTEVPSVDTRDINSAVETNQSNSPTEVPSVDTRDINSAVKLTEENNTVEKVTENVNESGISSQGASQENNSSDYSGGQSNKEHGVKILGSMKRKMKSELLQVDKRKKITSDSAEAKTSLKKKHSNKHSNKKKRQCMRKEQNGVKCEAHVKEETDLSEDNKANTEERKVTSDILENDMVFNCKFCPMKYEVEQELQDHMKHHSHAKKNSFTCSICGLKFPNTVVIQQHRKKNHVLPFICPENDCNFGFETEEKLLSHRHSKHNMSLTLLETYFPHKYKLYKCKFDDCNYETLEQTTMKYHMKFTHSSERPHTCDICGLKFKARTTLTCHKRNVHDDNQLKHTCSQCGKDFKTSSSMVQHRKRVHDGVKEQFPCSKCNFKGYDKRNLLTHMWSEHDIQPPEKYNRFECSHCGYKCLQKGAFQIHLRRHTGERCFVCEICGRSYVSASELHSHTEYHKDPAARRFKCDQCTFSAVTLIKLKKHVQNIHTNPEDKPYECQHEACPYRTNIKGNLVIHIRNIHKVEVKTKKTIQRNVLKTGRGHVNPKASANYVKSNTGQQSKSQMKVKKPKRKMDKKNEQELVTKNKHYVSPDLTLLMTEELTTGQDEHGPVISMLKRDVNIDNPHLFLNQNKLVYNVNKSVRNVEIQPKTSKDSSIHKKMVSIIKPSLCSNDFNGPMFIIPTTSENSNVLHIPMQGLVEPINTQQFTTDKDVNSSPSPVTSKQEPMTPTLVYTLPQVTPNTGNTLLNLATMPTTTTTHASHLSLDVGHTSDALAEFKDTGLLSSFLNDPPVVMMNPQPEDLSIRNMTDEDRSMTEQLLGVDGAQNYTFLDLN